ncbi:MAG: CvpA family protein, partial [Oscillospiraceae bacterium]|nr:CvpA family protein [Oscillospiraceae bacterium]
LYDNIIAKRLASLVREALAVPNQAEALSEFLSHPTIAMLGSVGISLPSAEQLIGLGEESAIQFFTSGAVGDFLSSLIRGFAFILLMFLFSIVVSIVIRVVGGITRLPLIGTVDKTLGLMLGVIKGVLWLFIISVAIYVLAVVVQIELITTSTINNTYILDVITENNPIIKMLF